MVLKICEDCGKSFEVSERVAKRTKYCSARCNKHHYDSKPENRKKAVLRTKEWSNKNRLQNYRNIRNSRKKLKSKFPERYKQYARTRYQNNPNKMQSRTQTKRITTSLKYLANPIMIKKCKNCGTDEHLEIHHEIYPLKTKGIIQAMKCGKIHYQCHDCHRLITHGKPKDF